MVNRIDGKCGIIKRFSDRRAIIRLEGGREVSVGLGFLAAPKSFDRLSANQMRKHRNKPHLGYRKRQRVCVSSEEPLYG